MSNVNIYMIKHLVSFLYTKTELLASMNILHLILYLSEKRLDLNCIFGLNKVKFSLSLFHSLIPLYKKDWKIFFILLP